MTEPKSHAQRIAERLAAPAGNLEYDNAGVMAPETGAHEVAAPTNADYVKLIDSLPPMIGGSDGYIHPETVRHIQEAADPRVQIDPRLTVAKTIPGIPTGPRTFKVENVAHKDSAYIADTRTLGVRNLGHTALALIESVQRDVAELLVARDLVMVGEPVLHVSVSIEVRCLPEAAGITHHLPAGLSAVTVEGK